MINVLDLFSGIGGFTLASSWVGGYRTLAFCEIEGFCRDLLKQNFPGIPIFEDVKELHPEDVIRQGEPVHLITAGFPCQDISQAGVQKGIKAERSDNLKSSSQNVAYSSSIRCSEGSDFRGEISEETRGTEPNFRDQASGENVSNSNDKRLEGHNDRKSTSLKTEPLRTDFGAKDKCEWGDKRESEPGLGGVVNGIPSWIHEPDIPRVTTEKKNRVKRLKSLGNSIVPQVAMIPLIRFREIYEEQNKT